MPKADYKKLSLADIGLSTPAPPVLTQTREQKRLQKIKEKKEKNARVKKTLNELKEQRGVIAMHKEFEAKELERQKRDKEEQKWARKAEHDQARKQRDHKERVIQGQLVQSQQRWTEAMKTQKKEEQRRLAAVRRAIEKETAQRAKVALPPVHIPVNRTEEIQRIRQKLPVTHEEQPIMEAINNLSNQCVLICGETGSGKTTQVPQFLWEAGYGHPEGEPLGRHGMIAVTEPRRVAAISMARRVAEELNEPFGRTVCYQVRYDNNMSPDCKMKFVTEGILLKELQSDFLLRKYSVVVVDEAHERSVSCDVLLGLLSRLVLLRRDMAEETIQLNPDHDERIFPLRLIVMSATLRVADFRDNRRLFDRPPPLIEIPVRRFPVAQHFARKTELKRYVETAVEKVKQIHKKLPPGGILVFLSTQREIEEMCATLKEYYSKTRIEYDSKKYTKAAKLTSRQRRAAAQEVAVASEASALAKKGRKARTSLVKAKTAAAEGETEKPADDEFGLQAEDYALDGDEDAPEGANDGGGKPTGDDFDYGAIGGIAADVSSEEEDGEARVKRVLQKFAKGTKQGIASPPSKQKAKATTMENDGWGAEVVDEEALENFSLLPSSKKRLRETKARKAENSSSRNHLVVPETKDEDNWDSEEDEEGDDEAFEDEADEGIDPDDEPSGAFDSMHILPLYSLLDFKSQQRVFEEPPENKRLCVIATNVAETSITIPNVRYVVDAGRVKTKTLQESTQAQIFQIQWISQAAAEQRAGRAGRTGPGHCYRLYSTAVFTNVLEKHTDPEILRTPLDSVALMMKHLRIDHVGRFPFPTPPGEGLIKEALKHLTNLGALQRSDLRCSPLGSALTELPVAPQLAKMIVVAKAVWLAATNRDALESDTWSHYGVSAEWLLMAATVSNPSRLAVILNAVLTCVSVCTATSDVFSRFGDNKPAATADAMKLREELKKQEIAKLTHPGSDFITFMRVFSAFVSEKGNRAKLALCSRLNMVHKALTEASQLRRQLASVILPRLERRPTHEDDADTALVVAEFDTNEVLIASQLPDRLAGPSQQPPEKSTRGQLIEAGADKVLNALHDQKAATLLSQAEERLLRQIIATGLLDHVCRRATVFECRSAGYTYQDNRTSRVPYYNPRKRVVLFIHPHSSIAKTHPPPEWVVYTLLERTNRKAEMADLGSNNNAKVEPPKSHMKVCTIVAKEWLDQLGYTEEEEEGNTDDDDQDDRVEGEDEPLMSDISGEEGQ